MNPPTEDEEAAVRHALNNLLGKILGAAELALDYAVAPGVRAELDTIIRLAEEGGQLTAALGRAKRVP